MVLVMASVSGLLASEGDNFLQRELSISTRLDLRKFEQYPQRPTRIDSNQRFSGSGQRSSKKFYLLSMMVRLCGHYSDHIGPDSVPG